MKKMKEIRLKNNYTHKKMGELLNISKTYYWQLENEQRTLSYEMAYKISKIYKLKPDDLFFNDFCEKINSNISI